MPSHFQGTAVVQSRIVKIIADNTLEEQAQWTVEAYQMGKQWGWVGTAFLWNLDYGVTAAGTELAQWGLLQPSGPVPAYFALAGMPK